MCIPCDTLNSRFIGAPLLTSSKIGQSSVYGLHNKSGAHYSLKTGILAQVFVWHSVTTQDTHHNQVSKHVSIILVSNNPVCITKVLNMKLLILIRSP